MFYLEQTSTRHLYEDTLLVPVTLKRLFLIATIYASPSECDARVRSLLFIASADSPFDFDTTLLDPRVYNVRNSEHIEFL